MNNYKVGQRVKVMSGANVTLSEQFNGMEGVITDITRNNTPDVMIYVDFENGYHIWCYTQKDKGIELNVEIVEPTPKWLPIDRDNLPSGMVLATQLGSGKVHAGKLYNDDGYMYLEVDEITELKGLTHYIPLSDLLNLPIAE